MKQFCLEVAGRFMLALAGLFGLVGIRMFMPDENGLFTSLRHDGKASSRNSMPGDLLTGLSGAKEGEPDSDVTSIKEASKKLFEKFESIKKELKEELDKSLKTQVDAMSKEKVEKINVDLDKLTKEMKDNNKKIEDVEKDLVQKIAASSARSTVVGAKEIKEEVDRLSRKIAAHWMRTGEIPPDSKEALDKLFSGSKEDPLPTKFLVGENEFVIPSQIDQDVWQKLSEESDILGAVTVVRTNTKDYRKLINRRGATISQAAEDTTRALGNAPSLVEVELSYGELYSRFHVASHALDDAGFQIESELVSSVGIDMAESLDADVITGNGTNTVKGLNAYESTEESEWGKILTLVSSSVEGPTYDDILDLIHGVKKRHRRNGSFLMGRGLVRLCRSLEDDAGNLIFQPSFNEGKFEEALLGYPIIESENMDEWDPDARVAYFGNLQRGYLLHILRDTRMIRDPYTLKGFIEFYVWKRAGGGVADFDALVALEVGAGS